MVEAWICFYIFMFEFGICEGITVIVMKLTYKKNTDLTTKQKVRLLFISFAVLASLTIIAVVWCVYA